MKTRLLFLLIAICLPASFRDASAQTLTEKLLAEDPARLATEAREKGDIVRGAILYHQGSLNCAKCHRANSEKERFGPNLANLNRDKPDAFIVESILKPSLEIKDGFETIVASTLEGKVFYGLVVDNNSQEIVLRDNSNIDQLINIQKKNLDDLKFGRKSSMPDGLAAQLKNRQQFLDLVRYVIDVKERGEDEDWRPSQSTGKRRLSPRLEANILVHEHGCRNCHSVTGGLPPGSMTDRLPPDLKWSAAWTNPKYLERYIANPQGTKPGTTMPQTLGHLSAAERQKAAESITHFLISAITPAFRFQPIDNEAVQRGNELFHSTGCVACHAPRDKEAREQSLGESLPLGELQQKYSISGLVEFLETPLTVRPGGRMPKIPMTHHEAVDIANFLLQKTVADERPWIADPEKAQQGKALFVELGCHNCHVDPAGRSVEPNMSLAFERLRPGKGCLQKANDEKEEHANTAPELRLSDAEKALIDRNLADAADVKSWSLVSDTERIDVTLRTFNCIACHQRNDLGGVTALRNPHFKTTNLNLGDQGRIPPPLNLVGFKLKPQWLRDVLVNGRTIRPYMKTRMPQYGEANIGHLVELFPGNDQDSSDVKFAEFDDQKTMREFGLKLAGNEGLNCVACHTYQYKLSDTMPAVDLTEMTDRLKKQWFYDYMLQPQKFSPNTVMPSFWPGGNAIRDDLEGNADFQIEALWQYLIDGRQAAMPRGVVREPMEIVVTDEAKMLRRQYPGIGKRGIGVGYPGGVNLAFDAEQMRLGMLWRGKFVDPVGVWSGQGSGNVRPLGKPIEFARGPDVDDAANPWIVDDGRPFNHQFLGYSLDEKQQPRFRYRVNDVQVQDFFTPFEDQATKQIQLRRTITLESGAESDRVRFRLASGNSIESGKEDIYSFSNGLNIRIASGHTSIVVDGNEGQKHLHIVVDLKAKKKQELVVDYLLK